MTAGSLAIVPPLGMIVVSCNVEDPHECETDDRAARKSLKAIFDRGASLLLALLLFFGGGGSSGRLVVGFGELDVDRGDLVVGGGGFFVHVADYSGYEVDRRIRSVEEGDEAILI
jgi:hypothetical protein